jgi:hypothetical protein
MPTKSRLDCCSSFWLFLIPSLCYSYTHIYIVFFISCSSHGAVEILQKHCTTSIPFNNNKVCEKWSLCIMDHLPKSTKWIQNDPNGNLCLRPLTQQNPTIHVAFMLTGSCTMPHVFGVRQTAKLLAGREQVRLFKGSHWLQNKTETWTSFSENMSKHSKKNGFPHERSPPALPSFLGSARHIG